MSLTTFAPNTQRRRADAQRIATHRFHQSLKTRFAFSRKNFGQTSSLKGT